MKIKEIESLTKMERSNIRFYERKGLISPKRLANGYRDYSENDLQILLRIKLLRSLHISIDEIIALKGGSKSLSDILDNQIEKLEREEQDVSYAKDLCRAIQRDRVDFADLDAKKYLDGINKSIEETASTYFSIEGDEIPQVFHPWRRFMARAFDIFMYDIIWSAFLAFAFNINIMARSNWEALLDTYIAIAIMLVLEPLLIKLFGTTPGKAIFGLRIEFCDGSPLSYKEGLKRTWGVISIGMGYYIPIYSLIRLWKSYKLCSENETQPWDETICYTIKDKKQSRGLLYIAAYLVLFAILFTITSAQLLPPNRGNITVAEFVENHNYYANHFGVGFGDKYLDESGKWAEKEFDNSIYIEIGYDEEPEYHFIIENGYVTGVSFEVEIENNEYWISPYNTYMYLISLAITGAQDQMHLYSKLPNRILKNIDNNTFKNFHFEEAGITFNCDISYWGYINTQSDYLWPEENIDENYFSLNFSVNKYN